MFDAIYTSFGASFFISLGAFLLNSKIKSLKFDREKANKAILRRVELLEDIIRTTNYFSLDAVKIINQKSEVPHETKERFEQNFSKLTYFYNTDYASLGLDGLEPKIRKILDNAIEAHSKIINMSTEPIDINKILNECWALTDKIKNENILFKR
ncbi:hypothetical protein JW930_03575 [Candidatus Woesearchaeota archaeon]|nr:hypothetical protein [Candidatus Woesearchaeota archaeon]